MIKINFFMFLTNFIFIVSHLKIHPAVHLNTHIETYYCGILRQI